MAFIALGKSGTGLALQPIAIHNFQVGMIVRP